MASITPPATSAAALPPGDSDAAPAAPPAPSQRDLDAYARVGRQRAVEIPNKAVPDTWCSWFTGWLTTAAEALRSLAVGAAKQVARLMHLVKQGIHHLASFVTKATTSGDSQAAEAEMHLASLLQQTDEMTHAQFEQAMSDAKYTDAQRRQARARRARSLARRDITRPAVAHVATATRKVKAQA